jgi:thiol-disulfide isomerase/thioredoxin
MIPTKFIVIVAGLFAFAVIAWEVADLIRPYADGAAGACRAEAGELGNFQATRPARPLPEVEFFDARDTLLTFAEYRGRGVVLNFWATWCAPCVKEMPALERARAKLAGAGIDVVTLSEDRGGAKVIRPFFEKLDLRDLPVLVDRRGEVLRALNVTGLPTTVLIDARGREVGRVVGIAEWDAPEVLDFLRRCIPGTG